MMEHTSGTNKGSGAGFIVSHQEVKISNSKIEKTYTVTVRYVEIPEHKVKIKRATIERILKKLPGHVPENENDV